jgi:tryptophanase
MIWISWRAIRTVYPMRMPRPIIEPFRIKVVEPIRMTSPAERRRILADASFNLFGVRAEDVIIDLLTDSGTGAMSAEQWAAIMRGDESYAGAASFYRFESVVRRLTNVPFIFPTHQGRAAERILCDVVPLRGHLVLSNGLFDTTRANIEAANGIGIDLPTHEPGPFGGNIDLEKLETFLAKGNVAMLVLTVTNNTLGGQPVSLVNLREAADRARRAGVLVVLDACRFAENAWRIQIAEEKELGLREIVHGMFAVCDVFTMSAKKDGIVNVGGMLGVRDPALAERIRVDLVRTEGFPTYGGLAGRDLDAMAQGLEEVLDPSYLAYRQAASAYLAKELERAGWPVLPAASHAVYVDAGAALPHLNASDLPGQSLACALYLCGGIRSCEIGTLMFPHSTEVRQLVRLALPRRVYTQSHVDYVGAVGQEVAAVRDRLPAMRIVKAPDQLRHFTAALAPRAAFPDFA